MNQETASTNTGIESRPARWQRLKIVLADALEQKSLEARRAVLIQSCDGDTALLQAAEKLLASDTAAFEEFAEFAATRLTQNGRDRIGERIGAYAIVKELGRGGMGAVYLAERADGQFEKHVAIKVLKRGTDTDEVLARFRDERQILANLEHPNITRLLDAGTTTDGLPYFVMEFIEGIPITSFVQQRNPDLRDRLKLFLKVCSAVDVAHQNHIIHRDIKPANVLVQRNGEPKLLDFGIAKLLRGDNDSDTTVAAERRLTPMYAAPEQIEGRSITVRTDVYSLGALLRELLTNQQPFHNVPAAKTERELKAHLDRIARRAMEKEPLRRYPSVADLASDIEQCLSGSAGSGTLGSHVSAFGIAPKVRGRWFIAGLTVSVALAACILVLLRGKISSPKNYLTTRSVAPAPSESSVDQSIHSIAVLPFELLGQDKNAELLGLGMADAITSRMSYLKQLLVMPTSAVLKYKGAPNDPLAAGRALHVDAILTGTVQHAGDRLRVTVQLVGSASRRMLWSEKFDQTFTDIFGIQDSIADKVARSLVGDLSNEQQKQLSKHYTNDTAAYDSYLMGVYFWNQRSKESLEKAIGHFQRAIALDPNYALAYAVMADCYYLEFYYGFNSAPDRIRNAKEATQRALQLDDSVAEGHVATAMVQLCENGDRSLLESDHQQALDALRRALDLNPNLAIAHQRYAWVISVFGHLDDAVRQMKRAQELDPLSPTNNSALGIMLTFARRFPEALEYCKKAAELDPKSATIQENVAVAYALNGMYQEAIEHYRDEMELNPESKPQVLALVAATLTVAGRSSEAQAQDIMRELGDLSGKGKADPYNMALLYAASGEKEQAFEWLDKALRAEAPGIRGLARMIRYDPMLDPLRSDARFGELLRQHNMASLLKTS